MSKDLEQLKGLNSNLEKTLTTLYPLKPIGIGTSAVESLSSYISRLAEAHYVTVSNLVLHEIAPTISEQAGVPLNNKENFWFNNTAGTLNGIAPRTEQYINALILLTEQPFLEHLTFWPWRDSIFFKSLIRQNRSWCPQCLLEKFSIGEQLYEPLIWTIDPVKICLVHNSRLTFECPQCGNKNRIFSSSQRVGHCTNCGWFLGFDNRPNPVDRSNDDFDIWVTKNISDLISQSLTANNYNVDNFLGNLSWLLENNWGGRIFDFADDLKLPSGRVWHWIHRDRKMPTLNSLLQVSYALRINLVDLLTDKKPVLVRNSNSKDGSNSNAIRKIKPKSDPEIESIINNFLIANSNPLSMSKIIRETGLSRSTLKRCCPDIYAEIVNKYDQYKKEEDLKRKQEIQRLIYESTVELYDKNITPSYRTMEKYLEKTSGIKALFWKSYAVDAWHSALEDMGL